jgi:phosphatidylserine/phosphatidylglycerophosphate/cardiolipin synthase-like enzyme
MPSFVIARANTEGVIAVPETEVAVPELAPRNCRLDPYEPVKVPAFEASEQVITYASPDSTFAVTKRLIDAAKKSILIGIYDFSAGHIKELLLAAMRRGVKIKLMLDLDGDREQATFDELVEFGVDGTPAPSCASKRVQVFRSAHEKVIVIDDEWSLVQSGNYSNNSIPLNFEDGGDPAHFITGNRDTGLAVKSTKLAKFFSKILNSDIALELNGPEALEAAAMESLFLVEAAPKKIPAELFPSKTFNLSKKLTIQPVLSPDNYMAVVPDLLRGARKSVLVQQQYIRSEQENIIDLLEAIKEAMDNGSDLDVRILLGKVFGKKDLEKEKKNLKVLKDVYRLKLGRHIRFVDTTRFVHCHNKMVLVDGRGVLVSSQNWSKAAVSENREAGLWLEHAGICGYFRKIFENDWKTAFKKLPSIGPEVLAPEALSSGQFVRVEAGDYREV